MYVIAVSGGIGSGKSVVCRILSCLGYKVYDCDSRAKSIMESDHAIKGLIADRITADAIDAEGRLDRRAIADVVFNDNDKLNCLNAIVHSAVRSDIERWIAANRGGQALFVETAILYQSGIDKMVDGVWEVNAPEDVRIQRVCRRNGLTASQVKLRIDAQAYNPQSAHPAVRCIDNDDRHSLLLQIEGLLNELDQPK